MPPDDPLIQPSGDGPGSEADPAAFSSPAWEQRASLPNRIGRYTIVRKLNDGGMGVVFEATQDNPRRSVALKVLKPGLLVESHVRRFQKEAEILASLRHEHIAQIYEADVHLDPVTGQGVPFFAMEYVPSASTLTEYAGNHGLSVPERIRLFLDVLSAVGAAHRGGITHRDLKPSNILVDPAGRVKVIDFGVARADLGAEQVSAMTQAGSLIGTLAYMSPEQYEDDVRAVDQRSDLYTLGVILHQLLSDAMPYDVSATDIRRAAQVVQTAKPRPLPDLGISRQEDLDTIIGRAMHKDPARRFSSAEEFAQDLTQFLDGLPISSRRDSTIYVVRRHVHRTLAQNQIAVFAVGVLIAVALWMTAGWKLIFISSARAWFDRQFTIRAIPQIESFEHVRVIEMRDGTDFGALALSLGIEGVAPNDVVARRALHARLAQRLAGSGCLAGAWAIQFSTPSRWDEDLVAGFRTMIQAGVPVVLGRPQWIREGARPEPTTLPILSQEPGIKSGGNTTIVTDATVTTDFVLQRGLSPPLPSIIALCYGTAKLGTSDLAFTFSDDRHRVGISPADSSNWWETRLEIPVVAGSAPAPENRTEGIAAGDFVGRIVAEVPSEAVLAAGSINFADALHADDSTLRRWVEDKIVIVIDAQTASGGRIRLARGSIGLGWTHAIGLEAALQGRLTRIPNPYQTSVISFLAAAAGGLIAVRWQSWRRRILAIVVTCIAIVSTSAVVYNLYYVAINPAATILLLLLGFGILAILYVPRQKPQAATATRA